MLTTGQVLSIFDRAEEKALNQLEDELSYELMAPKGNIRYAIEVYAQKLFEELEKEI